MNNFDFDTLHDLFHNQKMKTNNNLIDSVIQKFHFYMINQKYIFDDEINNKENLSNIIAVDQCDNYFMICFDDTFILIEDSCKNLLIPFFNKNKKSLIYF